MSVILREVKIAEKDMLYNLLQLYLYEYSQFSGQDINNECEYKYKYFDLYWLEDGRYPFFIVYNNKIVGFAFVITTCHYLDGDDCYSVAEFFVLKKYRREGIGYEAAKQAISLFPGKWEICYDPHNSTAATFWRLLVEEIVDSFEEIESEERIALLFEINKNN